MKKVLTAMFCFSVVFSFSGSLNAGVVTGNADKVLGQLYFTQYRENFVDGAGLDYPGSVVIDSTTGRVYVADMQNNRVLWWNNVDSLQNGMSADGAVGQPDLYSTAPNRGETTGQNTLNYPCAIDVDSAGNLWVADRYNNRVLRFSKPVTTGMNADLVLGQSGFTGNQANRGAGVTANTLAYPGAVDVDINGNVWVGDKGNHRVLKYSPPFTNGMNASLVIGQFNFTSNAQNHSSGTCASSLNNPGGVTTDSSGNVWVADISNSRVLRFPAPSANGPDANLVLGQADFTSNSANRGGSVDAGGLYGPCDVSVDSSGNVWVADNNNNRLLKYNTPLTSGMNANLVLGQANFYSNLQNRGTGVGQNTLSHPVSVEVDNSGNVWTADSNNRILKYDIPTANGINASLALGQKLFTTDTRNFVDGTGFFSPQRTAIDRVTGRIYVSDSQNNRILWWNNITSIINGKHADGVIGQADFYSTGQNRGGSCAANTLSGPSGIAVDSEGNIWVCDSGNSRVIKYNLPVSTGPDAVLVLGQANFTSNSSNRGGSPAANTLSQPSELAFDSAGNLWVADRFNHRILKYTPPFTNGEDAVLVLGQANFTSNSSNRGGSPAANTLSYPYGISINSTTIWVADTNNNRVLKYENPSTNGANAVLVLGQADFTSSMPNRGTGEPSADGLDAPYSVFADGSNNIWVTDHSNHRVLGYVNPTLNGAPAVKLLGQPDFTSNGQNRGHGSGLPGSDSLNYPSDITIDNQGNLWVVDTSNNRVLFFKTLIITSISPDSGTNTGTIDVQISGQEFISGCSVKLTKSGETDIYATNVSVPSSDRINCTFHLSGKTPGVWSVVVTTGPYSAELKDGFTIVSMPAISVNPTSLDFGEVKKGETKTLSFAISNTGAGTLTGIISFTQPWIKVDKTSFEGNLVPVNVTVDNKVLNQKEGVYTGIVNVVSNGGSASINIQLTATCVLAKPNPAKTGEKITFFGSGIVPGKTTIKIYTISGELIKVIIPDNADISWDGKDSKGENVSSGIYIYTYESPEEKGVGKITLIK